MTMISMEQEAVPAGQPTTYRQALGATRYRRAGTMTGWLNRKHRLFGRHFGSTGTGVVAATAWEAHVLAPSPIARSAHLREAAPPASLPFDGKPTQFGYPAETREGKDHGQGIDHPLRRQREAAGDPQGIRGWNLSRALSGRSVD